MARNAKRDPQRPPPLPKPRGPRIRALARLAAFVEIRTMRLSDGTRRMWQRARRRPALVAAVAAGVVIIAGLTAAARLDPLPDLPPAAPGPVAEAEVPANEAAAQRDLGHALWKEQKRRPALEAYRRALSIDARVADDDLVGHLVACFGGRDQGEAEELIRKNALVGAEEGLKRLVGSQAHRARWGAVRTLDRLGKGSKAHWEAAYIADLDSPDCAVRRTAVEKLGAIGTHRALAALKETRSHDVKAGGRSRSRCLGDRVARAEHRILARR